MSPSTIQARMPMVTPVALLAGHNHTRKKCAHTSVQQLACVTEVLQRRVSDWSGMATSFCPISETVLRGKLCGRGAAIRTRDLLNPIQVRYQAALRPDILNVSRRGAGVKTRRLAAGQIRG